MSSCLPYKLRVKCEGFLDGLYEGLRFSVEANTKTELRFHIMGSRETLIQHAIVTEEQFAQVPRCGISKRVKGIWAIRKLSDGWRIEILQWNSPVHDRLMSELREEVPYLDHILARLEGMNEEHARAVCAFTEAMLAMPAETTRTVGRQQRVVTWKTSANIVTPNWGAIHAQTQLARQERR